MTIISPEAPARTGIGARKDYHALNAQLNLFASDGSIQFHKDREAAEEYLRQHVIPNMRTFRSVAERLEWLVANDYYEQAFLMRTLRSSSRTCMSAPAGRGTVSTPSSARSSFSPPTP